MGIREGRQFDGESNGLPVDDRIVDNANVNFGYSTTRPRSSVSLFGRAGINVPREGTTRRVNYGGGLAWTKRMSERLASSLNVGANRNFSFEALSELGFVAPDLTSYAANAQWGLQYQSGPRTSMSMSLGYRFREFSNTEPILSSQIVLDEQPFGTDLSVPVEVSRDGFLDVPDSQDDVFDIIATEGLLDTENRSHFGSASFALSHGLSDRTNIGFNVRGGYRVFTGGRQQEGSDTGAQVYIGRRVGRTTSLNASYQISRSLIRQPSTTIQSLYGGVTTASSAGTWSLNLLGGVSQFVAEGIPGTVSPVANLSFSRTLSESTSASATYRRQYTGQGGFGRPSLMEFVGVGLSQGLGDRINFSLHAGLTNSAGPILEIRTSEAKRAGGSLSIRLVGGLRAGTSLFWTETEFGAVEPQSTSQQKIWSIFLNYGTTWP